MHAGPKNLITDVAGLRVGQAQDIRLRSGCTVLTADHPFTAAVHIMGGAPGTRETDLLAPDKLVQQVDVGYIAQQEANYRDQIIASLGVRFDKSSRNGDANKLYAFPKASLAINLAKFDFLTIDKVNLVKLRVLVWVQRA